MPGAPPGTTGGGDFGEMSSRLLEIFSGVERLKAVEENVEGNVGNLELCIKDVGAVCKQLFHFMGKNLEQEPLRFARVATAVAGGTGAVGGQGRFVKGIMEHKVTQSLEAVNGDKALFRQWHQKFTTALGQASPVHERVHRMVKEIELGKDMETIVIGLRNEYGFPGDVERHLEGAHWQGRGGGLRQDQNDPPKKRIRSYGVVYRWFTDLSGLGLAEQTRRLTHPDHRSWQSARRGGKIAEGS
jgi:hypothetical protein